MNNQSPLIPQGSLLDQRNKGRARVKIAVFLVLAIHGVGLMALLMQGCKREPDTNAANNAATNDVTNAVAPTFSDTTNALSTVTNSALATTTTTPPPVEPPPPVTAPPGPATDYVIVKGDTFSTIAKKFHVSTKALESANPSVEPTKLKIGQPIHIPAASTAAAPTAGGAATTADAGGSGQTYSVKSGDSLTKIANDFGISIKALRSANNLKTDKIVVGQKLTIPGKSANATNTAATTTTGTGQ
jgi:LysM repeat protein